MSVELTTADLNGGGEVVAPRRTSSMMGPPNNSLETGANLSLEGGDMQNVFRSSGHGGRSLSSPGIPIEDLSRLRVENSQLRSQLHQVQLDFQAEQDTVIQLKRRLNNIEKERLLSTAKANNEITSLESEATKLRAQLEKGEATRQNLEFELAKVRRDLSQAQKENIQKCESASETTNQMKEKISYLTEETTKLQQHIRDVERLSESGEKKLKSEIEEKEELLAKCLAEREIMKADRDRLEQVLRENDSAITELSQRLQDAETEKENNLGMLRRTTTELDYAKERGEHTKKELDIATKKIKSLEEIVEAERASHLESKFTSEIVQLRVRDLEGAVEVERGAQMESNKTVESLGLQIRHLQQTYEEQKKLLREGREKHERLQKEHDLVRYQLTAEVEDKKSAIQNLSKQLEIHQKNFNELRDELAKAKKRQIYLEETYGSSMREMELLVNNFCPDDKKKKSRKCDLNKKDTNKPQSASVLLGRLRHALQDYRKQVDKAAEETKKTKTQMEKVSKDNSSLKESVHTKNKAIEDTERSYAKVSRELSRVRSDYADLETLLARMKLDLQNSSQNRDRDHGKVQELSEEIVKLTQAHRAENEEKMVFLHNLYQKLLAARVQPSFTDKPFPNFSWQDMAPLVEEEFSALVQHATLNKQQVCQLEEVLSAKEEVLVSLEREHTQQVYQLNALNSDREAGWVRQREQLETHYNQLITDIQSRSKKSQAIADQAWEKVRASGTVRQSLETECVELRTHLAQALQDNTGLQIAVSLLCGALYPLYARANASAAIRKILEDELVDFAAFKTRVQEINNAMSAELGEAQTIQKSSRKPGRCFTTQRHPLLIFRRGVITVMAANRLKHFAKCSSKMFVTYDTISGNHGLLVCAGGVTQDDQPFTGVSQSVSLLPDDRGDNRGALDWLTSADLLSTVLASTTDLQDVIGQIKDSVNPVELRALKGAARACFTRLLDRLVPYFEGISLQPAAGLGDSHSLIRRLGKGLLACLQRASPDQSAHMQPYQEAVSGLKHHLLQLTERLHGLEVERRELLVEVSALRQDVDELTACKQHMAYLEDEIRTYREHAAEETVPVARFKSVCDELNAALSREEQAQTLMLEQSRQLEEFSTRLQSQNQQGVERDNALSQSVQGLSETKADLKRKEQSLRQLNKTVSQLEAEKKAVQNNLFDAENALRTAAKDKEILATYITTVESAVNQVKKKLSSQMEFQEVCQLPKQLLSVEFIPPDVGKAGPELIACQNLVGEFVDTLAQSFTRLKAAETEGASQSRHITSLKAELSAAVRRDYQEQEDYPVRDVMSLTRMPSEDSVNTEGFYRLRAESDTSICETPTCRPKPRKPSPAKTHQYKTPRKSARPITKPGSSAFR